MNNHIGVRFKIHSNCTALSSAVIKPNDYDVDGIEVEFGAQCNVCLILCIVADKLSFTCTVVLCLHQVSEHEWLLHADVL